jgi:phage tail sheath protein FI
VYARTDQRIGVHKAPANDVLQGVLDLEVNLTDAQQDRLNPEGINCLRAFPGRGIRVWGARTLSRDPAWTYVNVQRLFLTAGRWIERNMSSAVFEPNDPRLWARVGRELTAYFNDLLRRGALRGRTPQEAFYVKCDAETNPPEVRDAGMVVTEIGLAPALPGEFVVLRVIHGASGVSIAGPLRPGSPIEEV